MGRVRGGGPGVKRVEDKRGVERAFAGSRVQVVGRGVVEAQHVEARAMTGLRSNRFAEELPAVGDGRGEAKPGFVAVKHVQMAVFFQFPHPAQLLGFGGVRFWVLGLFQGVAKAPPPGATLFKKRRKVRGENSLASSWRSVAVTSLSCCRLVRTAWTTRGSSAASRMGRRPCPAAVSGPAMC